MTFPRKYQAKRRRGEFTPERLRMSTETCNPYYAVRAAGFWLVRCQNRDRVR